MDIRPVPLLEKLLMHHPHWSKFHSIISHGSIWPLHAISDDLRQDKTYKLIKHGNHKSAEVYNKQL
jgi:hypothetical protein